MNIIRAFKAAKSSLFGRVVTNSLPMGAMEFQRRQGKAPDVSQQALVRKYWGWVAACANISAVRFASTPLKLYATRGKGQSRVKNFGTRFVSDQKSQMIVDRLGKTLSTVNSAAEFEEITEHPLLDLLSKFNDYDNGFDAKELTSICLDLTGNVYWYLEKNKLGVPSRLFVLRPQWVTILPDPKNFIGGYLYGANNQGAFGSQDNGRLELSPDEVIHFKYPNPFDPWYGMGPVQQAAYAIESQELREKFVLATMGNMARPDLIIRYVEGELDAKERQDVEREWNSMLQGVKNAGRVKVTDYRWEAEKVGWNPSELKFNEGEEWILRKICSAFPVPEGLVDSSSISKAPRAGMEGTDLTMAQFNTLPRCTRFEQKLNERLCPMFDERLFFAFDDPVPKDRMAQLNEDKMRLETRQTTVNEIRIRDGLKPVKWGDEPNGGQQPPSPLETAPGSKKPEDPNKESNDQDSPKAGKNSASSAGAYSKKGEGEDHPFRGNQYTDGESGDARDILEEFGLQPDPRGIRLSAKELDVVLSEGYYSIISAGRSTSDPSEATMDPNDPFFKDRHEKLKAELIKRNMVWTECAGHWGGGREPSILVLHDKKMEGPSSIMTIHDGPSGLEKDRPFLDALGKTMNQESIIHTAKDKNEMVYTTGPFAGKIRRGAGHSYVPKSETDDYSVIPTDSSYTKFKLDFDWGSDPKGFRRKLKNLGDGMTLEVDGAHISPELRGIPIRIVPKKTKGGSGSGNFGHSGRPGEVGGSSDEGDSGNISTKWDREYSDDPDSGYLREDGSRLDPLFMGRTRPQGWEFSRPGKDKVRFICSLREAKERALRLEEKERNKKAFNPEGMTLEVDGQHIHPNLDGIPIRLIPKKRTRNESGQFDQTGPGRIHGSRETLDMLGGSDNG